MYDSIKPWINVPFTIKPFLKYSGSGTKQFDNDVNALCYPVGDVKLVTDSTGSEVTSTTQLYVDGSTPIKVTDNILFTGDERPILRIAEYYRSGVVDIKVVYL
jgi:hypothetical protein